MSRSFRRTDPQFFNLHDLRLRTASGTAGHQGVERALVSRGDAEQDQMTLTTIPAGSELVFEAGVTVEVVILAGTLEHEGRHYGVGAYLCMPKAGPRAVLRASEAVQAVIYEDPTRDNATARAFDPWDEPWRADIPGSHGLLHKSLRLPDHEADWADDSGAQRDGVAGGYLRLVFIAPGADPRQHAHHECWEGILLLRGDLYLGSSRGHAQSGAFQSNPVDFFHAPFASQGGALTIVQTDAPMDIPFAFRDIEDGQRQVTGYLNGTPLLEDPGARRPATETTR